MATIQVNGINLFYEVAGSGEPLLLIYGLAGRGNNWKFQVEALSSRFQVITFDNRGVGETDQPKTAFTLGDIADDAAALLNHLGVASAYVFGISMGGMIAQEFALRHQQRVRKLALGCTHPGIKHCVPSPAWVTEIFKSLPGKPREQVVRECTPINYSPQTQQRRPELIESLVPLFVDNRQRAHGYAGQLNAIWEFNAFDRLPELNVPTLVMTGTDDVLVVPGNSKIIAERIPNSRLIEFAEAGHLFFIEKAEDVNQRLLEFFQS
ncbi:MAG: alpha/beta fold hydrolase [Acidobacteriota bacterium]|nr:alpha/beta fold hydrolase [Acidobacteriota bacterium]